jgi:multimeric flavodoxin WrbA
MKTLLDATMDATDIVFVAPVYWYSIPAPLKIYLDHWSAWMRVPGLPFKEEMAKKTLRLITTSGDRAKAQPMVDSIRLCAQFMAMNYGGELWGKGGPPDAVKADARRPWRKRLHSLPSEASLHSFHRWPFPTGPGLVG